MAVCLDYQAVYYKRNEAAVSWKLQFFAGLLLLAALLCKVWIKVESVELGYHVAKERQKTVALDMERRELELQLSVLLRNDNLSSMAQKRLGLYSLNPRQARRIAY